MRRFVLGTAGHVDHGKTTLVQALTGIDTDRLAEEKRRGITIELGFAPWDLGDGIQASLIDVPGHRKLVHTMIAGASGIELVLLVVAADEGVMPQTREHVDACELLGIRRAVVAITKLDRVGEELARLAGEEARELCEGRFETDVAICSAKTGEGLDELTRLVRSALERLPARRDADRARLSVDRVFSIKGAGTVVTGTLVEGKIARGAPLVLASKSGAIETSARGLHVHDRAVDLAEAPTRLAVNLAGIALDGAERGDVLTDDVHAHATRVLDVAFAKGAKITGGEAVQVYLGTARSAARVALVGPAGQGDERVLARLRVAQPIVAFGGDRFVVRGSNRKHPSGAVLGGGVVLDADAPKRPMRAARRTVLEALARGDADAALRALVDEKAPRPLRSDELLSRFIVASSELRRAADSLVGKGQLATVSARAERATKARLVGWILPSTLADLARDAVRFVAAHHDASPLERGIGLETLRKKLGERAGVEAAEEAIRLAAIAPKKGLAKGASRGPVVVDGDVVRLASFEGAPTGVLGSALEAAARALTEAALKGVTEHAIGVATGASPRDVKAILAKLVRDDAAVHAGDLWFARPSVEALKKQVLQHFDATPKLTIAEFKELSGLGRRQAIVLLETLDREGVTKRLGDDRLRAG